MLLRGPSGVGKSDLALRALAAGWRLVADDRTAVWRSAGRLFGRAPPVLHGLVEARGQGVTRLPARAFAPVELVADLVGGAEAMERVPQPGWVEVCGVALPCIRLRPLEPSSLARLALALRANDSPAAKAPL